MNLGHQISRDTIANLLRAPGLKPAPERGKKTSWSESLKLHWEVIAANDRFPIEVRSLAGLVGYHVLFVIRLATREIHLAGTADQPNAAWATQAVRNLSEGLGRSLSGCRFLIHDRDPVLSENSNAAKNRVLLSSLVAMINTPRRALVVHAGMRARTMSG